MTGAPPTAPTSPPPLPRRTLQLTGAQRTLLIPLYAKALDYRSRNSILHDVTADNIVRSLDFDFSQFRSGDSGRMLSLRSRFLDDWVREFLESHPTALVVHLGCGLDARIARVGPPPSVLWVDLDLPEVIALRRTLYAERTGYRMIVGSIADATWLAEMPTDRPVIVVADGVLEYLPERAVRELFRRLADHFSHGVVVFDVMSSEAVRRGSERIRSSTGAQLQWGVDDLAAVDLFDARFRRTAAVPIIAARDMGFGARILFGVAMLSRSLQQMIRVVRYEF
jgi:O-methyltransferase involved in polyketide biosynthesis